MTTIDYKAFRKELKDLTAAMSESEKIAVWREMTSVMNEVLFGPPKAAVTLVFGDSENAEPNYAKLIESSVLGQIEAEQPPLAAAEKLKSHFDSPARKSDVPYNRLPPYQRVGGLASILSKPEAASAIRALKNMLEKKPKSRIEPAMN